MTTPTLFCEYGDEGRGGGGERGGSRREITVSSDSVDLASKCCDVCDVVCHGHKCWTRNLAHIRYITYYILINVNYKGEKRKEKKDEKEE